MASKVVKSEEEWRETLTPWQFDILRRKGTEPPFTGEYNNFKGKGTFSCAGCGARLFSSDSKFDSGTGWPSFFEPHDPESIDEETDTSHGMVRTEVLCSVCGGHLGHLFPDGPHPTGMRYCINSAALRFQEGAGYAGHPG